MPLVGTLKGLPGTGLVFVGNRHCGAQLGLLTGVEQRQLQSLLLAEDTVVILILPLVTRHPAVGTPAFLEQPACPEAARAAAWLVSKLASLTGQTFLDPERAVEMGPEASLALLRGSSCPFSICPSSCWYRIFSIPQVLGVR